MGFKVEFNSILRTDEFQSIEVGKEYSFQKEGSRIYFDDIPIWLLKNDWTALAEIKITSQERKDSKVEGTFKVNYLYLGKEQKMMTRMFKRMYGWK
ncbi:hypothetical protein A2866_04545 [Candidatus Roizmanbacteria bacterium RIFCSPHIGHO2_01_FULL_39_8]|uniref:PilZ domain-containing protein n=3 Tax=Candidatus Roizmaniibacteriota TaxID=1752723 RepID=A0A1F7GTF8_9BACT|nr:MAG: hypothetical protein A2866_04545 [Candidatus Roizmanbacteria bacterium RIFCSPHIGHO2_01_FULL_39_8]OGK28010.1 MAG: hypothetical protein A3C28_02775 [Candidatus Roizmanbacteria bacterium RIFCSPHIGHO2_02_FULL_39_9]OGK35719.1 MAG: hypothetical protein A3F60_00945 [Candidatus Roizmanbacteria bacterium RIFCSPHIGHO2_12_FULL_39_8]